MKLPTNKRPLTINSRRHAARIPATCLLLILWLLSTTSGWSQPNLEIVLHLFGTAASGGPADGTYPTGNLFVGAGNELYGVTTSGGTNGGGGTLFKINQNGSGYQVLHGFAYAETYGGNGIPTLPPYSLTSVIQASNGKLYGTIPAGGTNGVGAIFTLSPDGSAYTLLHNFGNADGAPLSLTPGHDGAIYGVSPSAIFKINLDGSGYQVIYTFTNAIFDLAPLTQGSNGVLYSTAYVGGSNNVGFVFKLNSDGAGYTVLHNFGSPSDDAYPYGGVIQGNDGALYGTTFGGANGAGTVFKLNPDGSGYTLLHSFAALPDGQNPIGGLVQGVGNVLYGTTKSGGTNNVGTIFQINPDGSNYSVLYNFSSSPNPYSTLALGTFTDGSGTLYGTTAGGVGTVFALLVNPPLTITPVTSSSQNVVFWPSWALNYTLQTTTNLATGPWVPVTSGIPVTGVQLTNTSPGNFFRLVQP